MASFLTGGSRFVAGRSAQQLGGGRSSPAMERPSSTVSAAPSKAAFTPRAGQPPPGSPSAAGISASSASMESTPSAAALAAAGGSPLPRAGLALQHLATGGQGGPKQGGSPSIGAVHSSLAYLAPDESSLQRSALAAGHSGASPLGPDSLPTAAGGHSPLPPPPEMPLSWVPPLALSRERLDMRCPRGEKAVHYRQAQREVYASYGECSRWDGLVSAACRAVGGSADVAAWRHLPWLPALPFPPHAHAGS